MDDDLAWTLDASDGGDAAAPPPEAVDRDLEAFRTQWRREVERPAGTAQAHAPNEAHRDTYGGHGTHTGAPDEWHPHDALRDTRAKEREATLAQALKWHLAAEALENGGDTHKALALYRKAAKVDPNVERRAYEYHLEAPMPPSRRDTEGGGGAVAVSDVISDSAGAPSEDNGRLAIVDMKAHMARLPLEWHYVHNIHTTTTTANKGTVSSSSPASGRIGSLPPELLVRILLLAYGQTNFDVARLVAVGEVCRAFYKIVQDDDLWRHVARRVWPPNRQAAPSERPSWDALVGTWGSLQRMCIERPRMHYHGIYISQYEYRRTGERTWESFYTPQHRIVYYRYIRCFPNGTALVVTTPDPPDKMVPRLKRPGTQATHANSMPNLFMGNFRVDRDRVTLWVSKAAENNRLPQSGRVRREPNTMVRLTITARIEHRRKSFSTRLAVTGWSTCFVHEGVPDETADHDISSFLPFIFSRVKSMS
eukprot:m.112050 g.112050  ORF g.112050 m.112050 type:complete len:479 (+) comp10770_c1_seq3:34-1470(+)